MTNATHAHVFYTDRANGWAAQSRDDEGNQIGEAAYFYRKSDAVRDAKALNVSVSIFGRNGLLQRQIYMTA